MTVLSNNLPGWFKRRRTAEDAPASGETAEDGAAASTTVSPADSTTTGGGVSHEPVVVWEAANLMEAQVVKGRLESEGIPAFIRSEAAGVIYGITAGNLARADVLVPGPLAGKAVELLFGIETSSETGDDTGNESGTQHGSVPFDDPAADQTHDQAPDQTGG